MIDSREEKLAARVIEKNKITPPFDLVALASKYASVEEVDIPWDIDGITLFLKVSGKRPKIIINKNSARRRKRFTLAHELAHVIIPWHVGNIVDANLFEGRDSEYNSYESEANKFAAELLMPSNWVNSLAGKYDSPADILVKIVHDADVSPSAACIKMVTSLPPGYIYAEVNNDYEVLRSGRSKNTVIYEQSVESVVRNYNDIYQYAKAYYIQIDGYNYIWWKLDEIECPSFDDQREWREILDSMVNEVVSDPRARQNFKQRLNGFLAVANDKVRTGERTADSVYTACLQKLSDQSFLDDFRSHKDFKVFLNKRVESFLAAKK
jgi:Zn-dependent peptidase ImmA (M78 family)